MRVRIPPIKCQGIKTKLVLAIAQLLDWEQTNNCGMMARNFITKCARALTASIRRLIFYSLAAPVSTG